MVAWLGSAKLDELIAKAERNNDDLAGAIARVQEADAQARIAGAALLPSLDLGATGTRERAQTASLVWWPSVQRFNSSSAQVTNSISGARTAQRDAARAAATATRYDQQTVALTVSAVSRPHIFKGSSCATASKWRNRISRTPEDSRRLQARAVAGTATGLDVAQQETTVAILNAAIPPLLQQSAKPSMRWPCSSARRPSRSTSTRHAHESVEPGRRRRSAVAAPDAPSGCGVSGTTVDCRQRRYHRARAALFPNIQLTAGGGYQSQALTSFVNPRNRVYAVSAGLTQPIFHGGALRARWPSARRVIPSC